MSVLTKGMEMPKACYECRMYEADIYYCSAAERDIDIPSSDEGRCSFCPLIELPDHGDLIDRDAYRRAAGMEEECEECSRKHYSSLFICPVSRECYELEKAPVVIPAERSEDA